jgi:hypothetical protein
MARTPSSGTTEQSIEELKEVVPTEVAPHSELEEAVAVVDSSRILDVMPLRKRDSE